MAKINTFDPLTSEARSPLIAGITEALSKLSGVLNLKTSTLKDSPLSEVYISEDDRYRIYQAPLGQKLWLTSPAPVIKKNGVVITPEVDNFTIEHIGGSVAFASGSTLTASDTLTVSATYIIEDSENLDNINNAISTLENIVNRYKGYYATEEELESAHVTATAGDFALVGGTVNSVFIWNSTTSKWENTFKATDLSDYYNKSSTDSLLNTKEPKISAQGSTATSDSYFWGGRKTWQSLPTGVLATLLTGISTSTGGTISADDNVLTAFGKLQKQITDTLPPIRSTGAPTTATVGVIGQEYINTSNGDVYRCTSISGSNYTWVLNMADKVVATHNANTSAHKFLQKKIDTVTLQTASWTGEGPWTQTVSIANVDSNSQVNINADSALLAAAMDEGFALTFGNDNGTVKAYAVGAKPTTNLTVSVTIQEVTVNE